MWVFAREATVKSQQSFQVFDLFGVHSSYLGQMRADWHHVYSHAHVLNQYSHLRWTGLTKLHRSLRVSSRSSQDTKLLNKNAEQPRSESQLVDDIVNQIFRNKPDTHGSNARWTQDLRILKSFQFIQSSEL